MSLTADGHVHSEWSWDALKGSMYDTCARAVELGLPAVAFTEHVDFTPFRAGHLVNAYPDLVGEDGILRTPPFDVTGYLDSIDRCTLAFPGLRILSGMEVGQPHRHAAELREIRSQGRFDRVIGSLHCLFDGRYFAEPFELFADRAPADVFRDYLGEIPQMVRMATLLDVLAHIDYPVRAWPDDAPAFDPRDFEDEFRLALRAVALSELALEINSKVPLHPLILSWWGEVGGEKVTFGSDGHEPENLGRELAVVTAMAEAQDFVPDREPHLPWRRRKVH